MTNSKSEIWLQALYGENWEDFEEVIDVTHAREIAGIVKQKCPERKLRVAQKVFLEKVLEEL